MSKDLNFTDILKFVNELSEQLDLEEIVATGEQLFKLIENLKAQNSLSKNIIQILGALTKIKSEIELKTLFFVRF